MFLEKNYETSNRKRLIRVMIGIGLVLAIGTMIVSILKNREGDTDEKIQSTDELKDFSHTTMKVADYDTKSEDIVKKQEYETEPMKKIGSVFLKDFYFMDKDCKKV